LFLRDNRTLILGRFEFFKFKEEEGLSQGNLGISAGTPLRAKRRGPRPGYA